MVDGYRGWRAATLLLSALLAAGLAVRYLDGWPWLEGLNVALALLVGWLHGVVGVWKSWRDCQRNQRQALRRASATTRLELRLLDFFAWCPFEDEEGVGDRV